MALVDYFRIVPVILCTIFIMLVGLYAKHLIKFRYVGPETRGRALLSIALFIFAVAAIGTEVERFGHAASAVTYWRVPLFTLASVIGLYAMSQLLRLFDNDDDEIDQ